MSYYVLSCAILAAVDMHTTHSQHQDWAVLQLALLVQFANLCPFSCYVCFTSVSVVTATLCLSRLALLSLIVLTSSECCSPYSRPVKMGSHLDGVSSLLLPNFSSSGCY